MRRAVARCREHGAHRWRFALPTNVRLLRRARAVVAEGKPAVGADPARHRPSRAAGRSSSPARDGQRNRVTARAASFTLCRSTEPSRCALHARWFTIFRRIVFTHAVAEPEATRIRSTESPPMPLLIAESAEAEASRPAGTLFRAAALDRRRASVAHRPGDSREGIHSRWRYLSGQSVAPVARDAGRMMSGAPQLYATLRAANPAPFAALAQWGDGVPSSAHRLSDSR